MSFSIKVQSETLGEFELAGCESILDTENLNDNMNRIAKQINSLSSCIHFVSLSGRMYILPVGSFTITGEENDD